MWSLQPAAGCCGRDQRPAARTFLKDESENLTAQNEGKDRGCTNRGTVEADMNVGGIAGTMAVENTLDPEDDDKDENRSLLRTEYTISAVVMNCVNEGTVTQEKGGRRHLRRDGSGLHHGLRSYGKVDGNNKVGGIAGHPSAKPISNWAKCELTGSKYIGGIVGCGRGQCPDRQQLHHHRITAPWWRSMSRTMTGMTPEVAPLHEQQQHRRSVLGRHFRRPGWYRSRGTCLSPIPCAALTASAVPVRAEPIDYDTMRALEGAPKGFQKLTLTFMADGHIVDQRTFTYGASFTEADYPELPQKDGYLAEWNTPVLDDLHLDTVVTALYTSYTPALKKALMTASTAVRSSMWMACLAAPMP